MNIIDCKKIAQDIKDNAKKAADGKGYKLNVLTNPYDEPSKAYVRNKRLAAEYCSIEFNEVPLDKNTKIAELLEVRNSKAPTIIQLPMCDKLNKMQESIVFDIMNDKWLDCDGFAPDAIVKPATASGVMRIFEEIDYDLTGKHVCIVGRGKTCAKPLVGMFNIIKINITNKFSFVISC